MPLHCADSSQVCIVPSVWQCGLLEFVKADLIWLIAGHFNQVSGRRIFRRIFGDRPAKIGTNGHPNSKDEGRICKEKQLAYSELSERCCCFVLYAFVITCRVCKGGLN